MASSLTRGGYSKTPGGSAHREVPCISLGGQVIAYDSAAIRALTLQIFDYWMLVRATPWPLTSVNTTHVRSPSSDLVRVATGRDRVSVRRP
jgi:hypothetical protein